MREHLRTALLETRQHLLKIKAGKYNEEEKKDAIPRSSPKADLSSSADGTRDESETPTESSHVDEDFETEKVEFFRKKRRPKAREALAGVMPAPSPSMRRGK